MHRVNGVLGRPLSVGQALIVLVGILSIGGAAFAVGAIPGPDGEIDACIQKRGANPGVVRVIDSSAKCSRREQALSWNQQGVPGPQGLAGQDGQTGTGGPQGLQGPPGSPDSGSDILAKLAPVDGGGSGLNADLLDGFTGSDFIRTTNLFDGTPQQVTSATEQVILNLGEVSVRTDGSADNDSTVKVQSSVGQSAVTVVPNGPVQTLDGFAGSETPEIAPLAGDNHLDLWIKGGLVGNDFVHCAFDADASTIVNCYAFDS